MRSALITSIQRAAARRFGLVTAADLRGLGATRHEVAGLVKAAVLVRVHAGVFRVQGAAITLEHRALSACLVAGLDAVASDETAAELWRLVPPRDSGPIHVTVPRARRPRPPGVVVHRRDLGPHQITKLGPIPITRAARTIADLNKALRAPAIDEALRRNLARTDQLLGFDRHLDTLARDRMQHGVPESELERRAIALLKRGRLPQPVRQLPVGRYRIDLAYPDVMLAIELDGVEHHVTHERWRDDLRRQNELELAGWRILRFTWDDITSNQGTTVEQIRRALSGARSRSRGVRRDRPGAR